MIIFVYLVLAFAPPADKGAPKIQSVTCPTTLTIGTTATCTLTLTQKAGNGGFVAVTSSTPSMLLITYPVTAVVDSYFFVQKQLTHTHTTSTSTVTKTVTVVPASPVVVPAGKTSTSFQVKALQ